MGARTPQEIWEAALGEIQVQVSKPNYQTWFSKTRGLSYQQNQFVIGVPNAFISEYLDQNQRSLIKKALISLTSPDIQVVFRVNGHDHHAPVPAAGLAAAAAARFNPNYVFASFVEGSNNRLARAAALAVAQNPGGSYNPLFIYGGAGLGKTHLLHAIGQAALANHIPVACVSAEQFTNEFIMALREHRTEEFHSKYRNAGMLLIDDVNFFGGKEQTEESFFHTFNELHNANRQIVVTSNCSPKAMPRLEERLRSRFEWGLIVDIKPPDFETRLAILQAKALQRHVEIPPEVLALIARHARRNVRELEGSLNRVVAYARLLGAPPSVELAERALEDIADKEPPHPTSAPDVLIGIDADCFQLSAADLRGHKRDKETTLARRVAMYLIRQETSLSLAQIGEAMGHRDAAAVTNACKKVTSDIASSHYLKRKIGEIRQKYAAATP